MFKKGLIILLVSLSSLAFGKIGSMTSKPIDISRASNPIVYATLYQIQLDPKQYDGKRLILVGQVIQHESGYRIIVEDENGCCGKTINLAIQGAMQDGAWLKISGIITYHEKEVYLKDVQWSNM